MLCRGQGAMDDRGLSPVIDAQIAVPRAHCKAVRLAHRGKHHDVYIHVQAFDHPPDDRALLVVLLAKERLVRLHNVEKLCHHRGHAAEVSRPYRAFQNIRDPLNRDEDGRSSGYIPEALGMNRTSTPAASHFARSPASSRG